MMVKIKNLREQRFVDSIHSRSNFYALVTNSMTEIPKLQKYWDRQVCQVPVRKGELFEIRLRLGIRPSSNVLVFRLAC